MDFNLVLILLRYSLGTLLLALLLPFSSFLRKRRAFEAEWGIGQLKKTDFETWFHVSSEGELEQIMPWVEDKYSRKENILILFTSPSLVNRVKHLNSPENGIHFACFSLTGFSPFSSHSIFKLPLPKEFFMVRYDFFPELIYIARKCRESILLGATVKGKREKLKKPLYRLWSKSLFGSFNKIFTSTKRDRDEIIELLGNDEVKVVDLDFRHGQILKRQMQKEEFQSQANFVEVEKRIQNFSWNNRIIFGSLWPNELPLFTEKLLGYFKEQEFFVFIAPHHLKGKNWDQIEIFKTEFEKAGLKTYLWTREAQTKGLLEAQVIICQIPGLLCEIYPYFGHSYIGGGHGRSIHSLLEPYWGGGQLYFGPKTHRSTEFDFVQDESPRQQHVVIELDNFYHILRRNHLAPVDRDHREKLAGVIRQKQQQVF